VVRQQLGYDLNLDGYDTELIAFGGEPVWRNPFLGHRLMDEEIAIGQLMPATARWATDRGPAPCQEPSLPRSSRMSWADQLLNSPYNATVPASTSAWRSEGDVDGGWSGRRSGLLGDQFPGGMPGLCVRRGGAFLACGYGPVGLTGDPLLVFLLLASGDFLACVLLARLRPWLAGPPGAVRRGPPGAVRRLGSGSTGIRRMSGSPYQGLAAPGDLFVGKEPFGEPIRGAEESPKPRRTNAPWPRQRATTRSSKTVNGRRTAVYRSSATMHGTAVGSIVMGFTTAAQVELIRAATDERAAAIGRRVYAIANYDNVYIAPDVMDQYSEAFRGIAERYYLGVTRYTTSSFMRLKLRHVLQSRDVAPHIHESRREAAAWLAHLRTSQA
jgi:hypothetical protein